MKRDLAILAVLWIAMSAAGEGRPSTRGEGCESQGAVLVVGLATPGSAGLPAVGMGGAPLIDHPFHLMVEGALGGAQGFLVFGEGEEPLFLPQYAATLHVAAPFRVLPFTVSPSGESAPLLSVDAVPPSLCGAELVAQAVIEDQGATGSFAFTQAVHLTFGLQESSVLFPAAGFDAGSSPRSLVVGDWNRDGKTDAAAVDAFVDGHTIAILLGVGNGTFRAGRTLETKQRCLSLAAGDLNADGWPDLAALSYPSFSPGVLLVFLGGPDGFAPGTEWRAGSDTWGLEVGDASHDGNPDVVVGNNDAITVLLGAGDGTLPGRMELPMNGGTHAVGIGDLNGDLVPDLVTANSLSGPLTGDVSVFLGAGDGTFQPALDTPAEQFMDDLVLGHVDGDGNLDLVVLGTAGHIRTYLGKGDGTFKPPVIEFFPGSSVALALGDLNGDLIPDLAVADDEQDDVRVWIGDGTGAFSNTQGFASGSNPRSLQMADVNGDQRLDVLAAASGFSSAFMPSEGAGAVALIGLGDGSLVAAKTLAAADSPRDVAIADLDLDSDLDLAVAQAGSCDCLSILLGAGDGSFAALPSLHGLADASSVAVGDWDQDQIPDLAVALSGLNQVRLFLGGGDGIFVPGATLDVGEEPVDVAVDDLDGDHVEDLVVANRTGFSAIGDVSILMGLAGGAFRPALSVPSGLGPGSVAIGDLNGDLVPDLAVGLLESDSVSIHIGLGDGTFAAPASYSSGNHPYVALGDLDADLALDLVEGTTDGLYVRLGNGDGTFGDAAFYDATGNWPLIGDFDADLRTDVLLVGTFNFVALLRGKGDGTLRAPLRFAVDHAAEAGAIGDLNGDLLPDVVTTNREQDSLSILTSLLLD